MLRYVCENPNCLNTFLSHDLDIFKKCELCGKPLIHVGIPDKKENINYPPSETIEDLKSKYAKLTEKSLRIGLLESERLTIGRAVRKLRFEERKQILIEYGLWKENIIYKHMKSKDGLWKMVIDKSRMHYQKKKDKKMNAKEISYT